MDGKDGLRIAYSKKLSKKYLGRCWMDGWMGGWMGGKAGLRIAYSNQQKKLGY